MIDLTTTIVVCPNCKRLRVHGVDYIKEDGIHIIHWYHKYGDCCEDILYEADYNSYRDSNYFKSLKDLFDITL